MKVWRHLTPLWEPLKLLVLNQKYLQANERLLKVLDRCYKNGIHQGYVWIYNAPCDKLTLFDYRKGRDQSCHREMLEGYTGILQVDGYAVYEKLFGNDSDILLVYCMAYARRYVKKNNMQSKPCNMLYLSESLSVYFAYYLLSELFKPPHQVIVLQPRGDIWL